MTRRFFNFSAVVLVVCAAVPARAAEAPKASKPAGATSPSTQAAPAGATPRTFAVPGRSGLVLNVPSDWGYSMRSPDAGEPPTIEFAGGKQGAFAGRIAVIPVDAAHRDVTTPANLRKVAGNAGQGMLADSKETKLDLVEIKGDQAVGYAFTLTDKAANPGPFENETTVFVGVGDVLLAGNVMHHKKDSPERQMMLDLVRSARLLPAAAPGQAAAALRVAPPLGDWVLKLPSGFVIVEQMYDPKRKVVQMTAINAAAELIMSVYMEPAPQPGDATAVRDVYWGRAKQSPMKKAGVKLAKIGDFATVEYTIPEVQGQKVDQRNLNLYAAHGGVWVDIHVSKMNFTDADKAAFDAIGGAVAIEPAAKP